MFKDFKKFILRGNVIDLAIAVIIGAAFGKIISSLVNDIIMPPVGLLLGKMQFADLFIDLSGKGYATLAAATEAGAPVLAYGNFIQTIIDFLIVGFVIFIVIRTYARITEPRQAPAAEEPTTQECPYCYSTINIKATRCPNCTSQLEPTP